MTGALLLVTAGAQPVNYLPEGSMTEGDALPAGWAPPTADTGQVAAARDTTVFKAGPASLRLDLSGVGAKGTVSHAVPGTRGKPLAVSAWVRTEGAIRGLTVAFVVPDRAETWFPVLTWGRARDWRLIRGRVTLPEDGGEPLLLFLVEGEGRVWLDEVSVEPGETYEPDPVAVEFTAPFLFGYGDWQGADVPTDDGVRITAQSGRGGLGITPSLDLLPFADWTPALTLILQPPNQARGLRMTLGDSDGTRHDYRLNLAGQPVGQPVTIAVEEGASLAEPGSVAEAGTTPGLDAAHVTLVLVQGDWGAPPVDVTLQRLELLEPTAEFLTQREQLRERLAREAEDRRLKAEQEANAKRDLLETGAPHPADGPDVRHVCAVAPDVLAITVQEKEYVRVAQVPYVPQEGDEIVHEGDARVLAWEGAKLVEVPLAVSVRRRDADGQVRSLGDLAINAGMLKPEDRSTGADLLLTALTEPAAYRISSPDDPAYAAPANPVSVSWKRKPNAPRSVALEARIYLHLAAPLREGKTYHVELFGINTRQAAVDYTHAPATVRSDSVHVSSVGFRPDDPYKRVFLSLWMGTGGPYSFAEPLRFRVLDQATAESVFEGPLFLVRKADVPENNPPQRNYTKADVYSGDFSTLNRVGTYRVCVDGIGCSYPFEIGEATWEQAFRVSLLGFLQQRSGIALGPPVIDYLRPRDMHPADGFRVFASRFSPFYASADQGGIFRGLLDPANRTEQELPGAWGGYHDAGDWDRSAEHLLATWQLLDLYDLFPAYFSKLKLKLPEPEAGNTIPDVLDEALWNLELFRRLQEPDGGVRWGIEMTEHPRPGEASWQNSLVNYAGAPDPPASLLFAAAAAKFSRVAARVAPELASAYREAALRAWDWADAEVRRLAAGSADEAKLARNPDSVVARRALASAELLWLTGEPRFQEAFAAATVLTLTDPRSPDLGRQRDATFTYARLPEGLGDPALKQAARAAVTRLADYALTYGDGNSFGLSTDDNMPPMGWVGFVTKPGIHSRELPRAYFLTGDPKYLSGAIRACQFALGANPENLTFTTGLGPNPVRWPLHIDSEMSGQPTPPGITVCGNSDPAMNYEFDAWAHTWFLAYGGKMVPDSRTWPMYESYWDIYTVPSTNEYQPHFLAQSAYYWGFLAARPPLAER